MEIIYEIISKKLNKQKIMEQSPTLIGVVAGIRFYEHPVYGDEYPLIASQGDVCGLSHFWEVPDNLESIGYHLEQTTFS